ncbi:hypothetical protein NC652_024776 [Populus alba x Populus x berolinensis]|uniref:Uncharacterized protein n=2 Tax=Populus TaxID=3689 RepID=A0ACC4BGJ2_POPAL|nr:hypothetical protein NC652_024772 [Populus alba x Populus x berolinensis]KAJ6898051.1 hypothetical protein NC652_024776 [Populus alba x Populus x berolinensis]KAJ6980720.1 hypothetical protein NC653_024159 [Populus alba x Populus x berolinensis]KAJ6981075.1 hypothetical protein NC653_024458 [Populus alba x Populus x berolinensis]
MPNRSGSTSSGGMKSLPYYYDEARQLYIWVLDTGGDFSRMVKQQYISLEDLRDYSKNRISRDHQRGCISYHFDVKYSHTCVYIVEDDFMEEEEVEEYTYMRCFIGYQH